LTIATTTSVDQSGLLAALAPAYRYESGVEVRAHAVGSGQALQMLARGDAGVAISHAPSAEAATLASRPDWIYRKFAFNEFIVVGPRSDPAQVRESANAVDAFRRIAQSSARFVSRGDQSGTHEKEERLWALAKQRPGPERLIVSGRGMAQALRHADEAEAYTVSDEATFRRLEQQLELAAHYRGDPVLVNSYALLYRADDLLAANFTQWMTRGSGRSLIRSFTVDGRKQYSVWPEGCSASAPIDEPCRPTR
jgi:tungstate transport system substrate-binding protein